MAAWRDWFKIDRAWVERRDAALRAAEDAMIAAARDRATGAERAFLEELVRLRGERSFPGSG